MPQQGNFLKRGANSVALKNVAKVLRGGPNR
jgi:hypothetical protein